jgi:hypothetical protein
VRPARDLVKDFRAQTSFNIPSHSYLLLPCGEKVEAQQGPAEA